MIFLRNDHRRRLHAVLGSLMQVLCILTVWQFLNYKDACVLAVGRPFSLASDDTTLISCGKIIPGCFLVSIKSCPWLTKRCPVLVLPRGGSMPRALPAGSSLLGRRATLVCPTVLSAQGLFPAPSRCPDPLWIWPF